MAQEDIKIRSQEVQDILKKMPHSLIRWGNSIIFLILVLMGFLAFFIKFPTVFQVPVIITAKNPPEQFTANRNGKIERLFFDNKDVVSEGDVIAVMKNTADFEDVMKLKTVIDSISAEHFESNVLIPLHELSFANYGTIQPYFRKLEKTYSLYESSKENSKRKYKLQLWEDISMLRNEIDRWETNEVYRASFGGELDMLNLWHGNQTVSTGDILFSVTPENPNGFIGRIESDSKNFSILNDAETIQITLQPGITKEAVNIEGEIRSISSADSMGKIYATVDLSEKNEKILNSIFVDVHSIQGTVEIITEDLRLIERFFQKVRNKIPVD